MQKPWAGAVLAACLASAAGAATIADVDALIDQANAALRAGGESRASSLREAIDRCKRALELLGEVEGISDQVRDRKSSDILSTLYWCRKMLPLDLSGHEQAGASKKAGAKAQPEQEGASPATPSAAPARATQEHDKHAFELVQEYARRQPQDLEGIVIRYEGVAASYPNTEWGKKALDEAGKARQKLEKSRAAVLAARRDQIQELRLAEALKAIEEDRRSPQMEPFLTSLDALAADVRSLQRLHAKVVGALKLSQVRLEEPLGSLGIEEAGWLLGGDWEGVDVALGTKSAPKTRWPWSKFGAKAMARLGGRFAKGSTAEWAELVAVGATVTEDYVLAHDLFGKLLILAPERVSALAGYFERATSGYRSSSEGRVAIRLNEAKNLVRKRKFEEAFALINEVRADLASNSAMVEKLREVNDVRRELMLKNKLNDLGKTLSPFEEKVRAVFGGDVKLDEGSGRIEVLYDFSDSRQLRDFGIAYRYGQWKKSSMGFQVAKGQLYALGKKLTVFWMFPVKNVDVQVDVTYFDKGGRFDLSLHNNEERYDSTTGGFSDGEAGYVSRYSGQLYSFASSFREQAPIIWRPGETATVQMKAAKMGPDYFDLFFNGDWVGYTYSYSDFPGPGAIGFGFNGGKGAIDNVLIRGTLDMQWFEEYTSPRGRQR